MKMGLRLELQQLPPRRKLHYVRVECGACGDLDALSAFPARDRMKCPKCGREARVLWEKVD